MKNTIIFIAIVFALISCQTESKEDIIKYKKSEQLKIGAEIREIFLDLRFGLNTKAFELNLKKKYLAGKLEKNNNVGEGFFYYNFSKNTKLKNIAWRITNSTHNDSIISFSLFSQNIFWRKPFENIPIEKTYKNVIEEYISRYGKPSYVSDNKNQYYWFIYNIEINVGIMPFSDGVFIRYTDSRRKSKIIRSECYYTFDGDSEDKWYFETKKLALKKLKKEMPNIYLGLYTNNGINYEN